MTAPLRSFRLARLLAPCSLAALLAIPLAAGADDRSEVVEKHLPPGLSVAEAKKLGARLDELAEQEHRKHEKKLEARREKLEKSTRPFVDRLEKTVDADPKLKQRLKKAERRLDAVARDESLSDEQRGERIEAIAKEIEPLVNEVLERSEFDGEAFRKTVEDALEVPERARKVRERALRTISTYYFRYPYTYTPPPPAEVEEVLVAPYPERVDRKRGPGSPRQEPETPLYYSHAVTAILGYFTNESGLGHFAEVPSGGYTRFRVDAEIPRAGSHIAVLSMTPGWNSASVRTRVEVMAQNRLICRDYVDHGSVWTIWGWAEDRSEQPIVVYCEGDAPPAGEKVVVRYVTESTVGLTAGGWANSSGTIRPSEIRLKFMK